MRSDTVRQCTFKYMQYLQLTVTVTVWLTALPTPLLAIQRYVPSLFLLLLRTSCEGDMSDTTECHCRCHFLNTFVQVMFGVGSPLAEQDNENVAGSPSTSTWSAALAVSDGGTARGKKLTVVKPISYFM